MSRPPDPDTGPARPPISVGDLGDLKASPAKVSAAAGDELGAPARPRY